MTEVKELYNNVILGDFCIGCGACACMEGSPFKIKMDDFGKLIAYPLGELDNNSCKVLNVCPFSGKSKNENEIAEIIFKDIKNKNDQIGRFLKCYAGYVADGPYREIGSSGGLGKWLGYTLLKEKKIDFFVHVVSNQTKNPANPLFDYKIISDKDEVLKGSKSAYYPVSLVNIIENIKKVEGRYAITGVSCFVKTLRLMTLQDEILKKRIKYTIGIICGGMKSANHAKIIGWQLGIKPENLISVDFRRKTKDLPSCRKIYQAWSNIDNKEKFKDSNEIFGTEWFGYFIPNACDYCDDVVSEIADISIGDAWLPNYVKDPEGTSLSIIRNNEILELIEKYIKSGELQLNELTSEDIVLAQSGGFRHRREALSYRLAKKKSLNKWYPEKRVKPNEFQISSKRKQIYNLREKILYQSHIYSKIALQKSDINIFYNNMKTIHNKYLDLINDGMSIRIIKKINSKFLNIIGKNRIIK